MTSELTAGLESPWPEVFALMWEAYRAGTIPVGAVVLNEANEVVSRGRNRIFDTSHDGQFGASRLAHAELNALLGLSSERTYEGFTIYTALEPCHLCLAATIAVRVGHLRYAATDRFAGAVGKVVATADHEAHPLNVDGPLEGDAGRLPELLHLAHCIWRVPNGGVATFYRCLRPDLVAAAKKLPAPGTDASLDEAFATLAP